MKKPKGGTKEDTSMRCSLRLFQLGFFCALILACAGLAAAGEVTFFVQVEPSFAIAVQEQLFFPKASPGTTVDAELDVQVWSNVGWDLMVVSHGVYDEEANPVALERGVEVQIASGQWRPLDGVGKAIHVGQPPTPSEGAVVTVPFRFQPEFGDLPGTYAVQVVFTVVPEI
jgi:hypothetical protein